MESEKRVRRLEMQKKLLASKLYQVCLSHDHLSTVLQRSGITMTNTDRVMMETTKRIINAKTPEEMETIYSESSGKIFKGMPPMQEEKPKSGIQKIWFFPQDTAAKDLISHIEDMISQIDEHIQGLSKQDQDLYEDGMQDPDADEDGDTLRPPF